jgi:serine/threonine protein kinase
LINSPLSRGPSRSKKPIPDRLKPGDVLSDRYRVIRMVGRGGMGEVYEAEDTQEKRRVALKTVLAKLLGSQKVVARFRREIELSQRISHPNVLAIYDVFEMPPSKAESTSPVAKSSPCMVMEFLEGETLADRLEEGRLVSTDEARGIVVQIAQALVAAHKADVVHRDLKPDNIFLVKSETDESRVVLMDFGVARPSKADQEDSFTATDVIVGTPTYMAPEQLELEEALPASDLYTLGLVIYEMITGKFPFEGDTAIQVVFMRVQEPPIPPRRFMPELDDTWDDLIMSCLERDPKDRISTAEDIIILLEGDEEEREEVQKERRKKLFQGSWWPFKGGGDAPP